MRFAWISVGIATAVLSFASLAFGQTEKKEAAAKPADASASGEVSPYSELIAKGNAAYVAGDYDAAATAYKEAIPAEPGPLPHYMLGQTLVAQKKLDEAEGSYKTALRFGGKDPVLRAKIMFVLADLRERQAKLDEANTAWKEYGTFVASNPKSKGYASSAVAREKAIATHKDLKAKYAKVKERIQQRLVESKSKKK